MFASNLFRGLSGSGDVWATQDTRKERQFKFISAAGIRNYSVGMLSGCLKSCNLQHFGTVYLRTIMDHVSTHIDVLVVAETFPWLEIRCDVLRLVHWIRFQPLNHHDIQQLSTLEGAK